MPTFVKTKCGKFFFDASEIATQTDRFYGTALGYDGDFYYASFEVFGTIAEMTAEQITDNCWSFDVYKDNDGCLFAVKMDDVHIVEYMQIWDKAHIIVSKCDFKVALRRALHNAHSQDKWVSAPVSISFVPSPRENAFVAKFKDWGLDFHKTRPANFVYKVASYVPKFDLDLEGNQQNTINEVVDALIDAKFDAAYDAMKSRIEAAAVAVFGNVDIVLVHI